MLHFHSLYLYLTYFYFFNQFEITTFVSNKLKSTDMTINNLLKTPIFHSWTREKVEAFVEEFPHFFKTYRKGQYICFQNDPIHTVQILYDGKVRALMGNDEGKQITIEYLDQPQILASAFIFATQDSYPVSIEVLEDSKIMVIQKKDFLKLMQDNPIILENFLKVISDKALFLSRKVDSFALKSLSGRLASFLLEKKSRGYTQQEIADVLGVARPSLARVLADFVEKDYVRMEKRRLYVENEKALRSLI